MSLKTSDSKFKMHPATKHAAPFWKTQVDSGQILGLTMPRHPFLWPPFPQIACGYTQYMIHYVTKWRHEFAQNTRRQDHIPISLMRQQNSHLPLKLRSTKELWLVPCPQSLWTWLGSACCMAVPLLGGFGIMLRNCSDQFGTVRNSGEVSSHLIGKFKHNFFLSLFRCSISTPCGSSDPRVFFHSFSFFSISASPWGTEKELHPNPVRTEILWRKLTLETCGNWDGNIYETSMKDYI
jgi:hypothetical protein